MARDSGSNDNPAAKFFDTSGSVPVPKIATLATAFIGSIFLGGLWGVIDTIGTLGGAITSTAEGFGVWVQQLIRAFLGLGAGPLGAAFEANAAFLSFFGTWAQAVAVLEVVVLAWLTLWGAQRVGGAILGGVT